MQLTHHRAWMYVEVLTHPFRFGVVKWAKLVHVLATENLGKKFMCLH